MQMIGQYWLWSLALMKSSQSDDSNLPRGNSSKPSHRLNSSKFSMPWFTMVAVATALGDNLGRKTCNDMGILGSRVSSITGSGPAIFLIIPSSQEATVRHIKQTLGPRNWEIIGPVFARVRHKGKTLVAQHPEVVQWA